MKKLFALILSCLLMLGGTATLAEAIDYTVTEETTVVFWHTLNEEDDAALLERMISEFEAAYPLIKVQPIYKAGYNDINTELAASHAAGVDVPSCAFINVPRLAAYSRSNMIEDLLPYVEANGTDMSDWAPGFMDAMYVDGKLVALPFMMSGQVTYYNKTVLDEHGLTMPENWDDMDAFMAAAFEATGKPVLSVPAWDNAYFYPFFSNAGAHMIDVTEDGEVCGLDNEDALAVAKKLKEWVDAGYMYWGYATDAGTIRASFTGGETLGLSLYTTANYDNLMKNSEFEIGIAVPPMIKENNQLVAGGTFIMPSNNSQQVKNAAYQFMTWMTDAQYTIDFSIATSYLPTHMSVLENEADMAEYYTNQPAMGPVIDNLANFEKKPQSSLFDTCGDIFENYMGQLMLEQVDFDSTWEVMVEEINEYLADQ